MCESVLQNYHFEASGEMLDISLYTDGLLVQLQNPQSSEPGTLPQAVTSP